MLCKKQCISQHKQFRLQNAWDKPTILQPGSKSCPAQVSSFYQNLYLHILPSGSVHSEGSKNGCINSIRSVTSTKVDGKNGVSSLAWLSWFRWLRDMNRTVLPVAPCHSYIPLPGLPTACTRMYKTFVIV